MQKYFEQVEEKSAEYKKYILEHQKNVQDVWEKLNELEKGEICEDYHDLYHVDYLVKNHDASKYRPEEFNPYRCNFYPCEGEESNEESYNQAWNHHQKTNPHHWQYWVLINDGGDVKVLKMQFCYLLEMLCDWSAMSVKFGDLPSEFYAKNKNKIKLHTETRAMLERFLPKFDNAVNGLR